MPSITSYQLATLRGNALPSTKDVKEILTVRALRQMMMTLNRVIRELHGKNIKDVPAQGISKLTRVPACRLRVPGCQVCPAAAERRKSLRYWMTTRGSTCSTRPHVLPIKPL